MESFVIIWDASKFEGYTFFREVIIKVEKVNFRKKILLPTYKKALKIKSFKRHELFSLKIVVHASCEINTL